MMEAMLNVSARHGQPNRVSFSGYVTFPVETSEAC